MKNLVEVITKALVDEPEKVVITEKQEGKTTVIEVRVSDNWKTRPNCKGNPFRCKSSRSKRR